MDAKTKQKQRDAKIRQALELSSDQCSHARYLAFRMTIDYWPANTADDSSQNIEHLVQAIYAGRDLVKLIRAEEFAPGNLYTFVPTRWYVRSLYLLGSFYLSQGSLNKADMYLTECLLADKDDKLGARHKQLRVVLKRGLLFDKSLAGRFEAIFSGLSCKTMSWPSELYSSAS